MKIDDLLPFGARVSGICIAGQVALSQADVDSLKDVLARKCFVHIPNQMHCDDGAMAAFMARFGQPVFTTGETPVAGAPMLNLVTNVGRKRPPRSVFHTDTSYIAKPPAYTALRAIDVPESGGETLISNQMLAWRHLPSRCKDRLKDVKVRHVLSGLDDPNIKEREAWHPLARRHPRSKQRSLYLSALARCAALSGFNETLGLRLINALYAHSVRRRFVYAHRWHRGDILMWDNRCTMHRADHSAVCGKRTFHRGMAQDCAA